MFQFLGCVQNNPYGNPFRDSRVKEPRKQNRERKDDAIPSRNACSCVRRTDASLEPCAPLCSNSYLIVYPTMASLLFSFNRFDAVTSRAEYPRAGVSHCKDRFRQNKDRDSIDRLETRTRVVQDRCLLESLHSQPEME